MLGVLIDVGALYVSKSTVFLLHTVHFNLCKLYLSDSFSFMFQSFLSNSEQWRTGFSKRRTTANNGEPIFFPNGELGENPGSPS